MDPIKNPFSPGAGSPPPELVGRDEIMHEARVLFGRVRAGKAEKSILLTGLRGVGKTVLLNEMERLARAENYLTVVIEAHENKPLGQLLAPYLKTVLYELDRMAGVGDAVKRGLAVLRSFISGLKVTVGDLTFGLDIEPDKGAADSGDIEIDLPRLFVAIGEAAKDRSRALAIFLDEVQYFAEKELAALIMAMHRVQQRQLPIALLGAGLPILPRLAGESKSYAERLFSFPDVGPLSAADAAKALQDPANAANVAFQPGALDAIFHLTQGYAYFVQEWGYQSWNQAEHSPITEDVTRRATPVVISRLDQNFFRVRFDRLTPNEKKVLRAIAELGPGPYRTSDVADTLRVKITSIGPVRASLIKKGMIYSSSFGELAFTVPLFNEFMIRAIPTWQS
jgi:AAA ATPase domain